MLQKLFAKKIEAELYEKYQALNTQLEESTRELRESNIKRAEKLEAKEQELNQLIKSYEMKITELGAEEQKLNELKSDLEQRELLVSTQEDKLYVEDCGMYTDLQQIVFKFSDSESYQEAIKSNMDKQKELVTLDRACDYPLDWHLNGSRAKGDKLIKQVVAMALRCFNAECGAIVESISSRSTYNSIDNKLDKAFRAINRLNSLHKVCIKEEYLELKREQAHLVYEQCIKIAEEKAEAKRQREILREEEKLAREIEREMEKLNNERVKYEQELQRLIEQQLDTDRIEELQDKLSELDSQEINLETRLHNRAGYVYVVSNPLMPNHLKLGVTRRLDPMDRIRELSSASLAFKLDVHAIMFAEDAFALENKLHRHFDDRRVNKANKFREWFDLSVDEVKEYIHNEIDSTVEFRKVYNEEFEMSKVYKS